MDAMIRELQKRTGMTFSEVVRGITAATLTNTAIKTKQAKPASATIPVTKIKRRGFKTSSGATITVTKAGKVWYRGAGWAADRHILLTRDGKTTNVKETAYRTGKVQKQIKINPKLKAQINRDLGEVRKWATAQTKYLRGQIGASKASFLHMLRQLRLQPTSTRGLGRAMKVVLPANHKAALSATQGGNNDQFQIQIRSTSQSALNPRAGGIGAFSRSLRGQVKAFETAAKKDVVTYAKRFAARSNVKVTG